MKTNKDANSVLISAKNKARKLQHNYVGTEHLLHGMLLRPRCGAMIVLKKMGLKPKDILRRLEEQISPGPIPLQKGAGLPLTPRSKKLLELADKEASSLDSTQIGSEHLLLAMIREGDGVAARVLRGCDIPDLQSVRDVIKSPVTA